MKTVVSRINNLNKDLHLIEEAAKVIKEGGIAAFPTETVYGLGADALNGEAVKKIFEAKGRPQDNPLIIHVASKDVSKYASDISEVAQKLMDKFWPGPLTVVLNKKDIVPDVTSANLKTIGIRMPDNEIALKLIELSETTIAAPSANISGRPSPTDIERCVEDLDGKTKEVMPKTLGEKIDVTQHSKKTLIATIVSGVIAIASLLVFTFTSTTFNYTSADSYGRIEVRSTNTQLFENLDKVLDVDKDLSAQEKFVYYLENEVKVKVKNAWTITDQKNPLEDDKYYIYFYADLENVLSDEDMANFEKLENYVKVGDNNASFVGDENAQVTAYTVNPGVVRSDFTNTLILIAITVGITLVYFIIRYRYSIALANTASLILGSGISLGLISLIRLEVSNHVGIAVLAGAIMTMLLFIPINNRLAQVKNESKTKITTFAQREEIAKTAYKDSLNQYFVVFLGEIIILLCLIPVVSLKLAPMYVACLISLIVNALLGLFMVLPLHLFFEKHLTSRKSLEDKQKIAKAKREKIAKANRNKGAEPEEIIIPGIND